MNAEGRTGSAERKACQTVTEGEPMEHYEIVVGTNQPITNKQARELLITFIKRAEELGVSVGGEWRAPTDA